MRLYLFLILFLFLSSDIYCQDKSDSVNHQYFYFFNTNPYNAEVIFNDSTLGYTPIRFFTKEKLEGSLIFKKDNYNIQPFNLSDYDFNSGRILELVPLNKKEDKLIFINKETQFKTKRNFYAIGGFGLGALASVISTIKFKNIANNSYDNYLSSLDNSELDKSKKYDAYSVISLIAMQAAIAGLVYFLFVDK
jgi:hypothetical protein